MKIPRSAKFMGWSQKRKLFSSKHKGLSLNGSKSKRVSIETSCAHTAMLGVTGAGKTKGFLIPNLKISEADKSFVVVDTGEVYKTMKDELVAKGFVVQAIHTESPKHFCQFNPLSYIQDEADAARVANTLFEVHCKNKKSGDPFWEASAQSIIQLIIKRLALSQQQSAFACNLSSVSYIINQLDIYSELPESSEFLELEKFFISGANQQEIQQYKAFTIGLKDNVRASVLATAKAVLAPLNSEAVRYMTEKNTVDFKALRQKPTVMFIIIKENRVKRHAFFLSLFFEALFDTLMQSELNICGDTPPVFVFMDEAGVYKVDHLEDLTPTLRKKRVGLILLFQDIQQLRSLYGDEYKTILGNCLTKLVLGGLTSLETTDWLEKLIGDTFIEEKNGFVRKMPLLSSFQIRRITKQVLCIYNNCDPVLLPYRQQKHFWKQLLTWFGK